MYIYIHLSIFPVHFASLLFLAVVDSRRSPSDSYRRTSLFPIRSHIAVLGSRREIYMWVKKIRTPVFFSYVAKMAPALICRGILDGVFLHAMSSIYVYTLTYVGSPTAATGTPSSQ